MNKSRPRWFNGPIKTKYIDPEPANFLDKPKEKIIKPKVPWIIYIGKSNKIFKLESLFQLYRDVKPKISNKPTDNN